MSADQRRAKGADSATRQSLLASAVRLIEQGGVAAATSRAIADDADANLGAITYYFGSKDALVAAALADIGRTLLEPVVEALSSSESPLAQLQRAVTLLPAILDENPAALRGYVHALATAVDDPAVRDAIATLHHEIAGLLEAQITRHQAAGLVPTWVRPAQMAATIISLVNGVAITSAAQLIDPSPVDIAAHFAALLVDQAGS